MISLMILSSFEIMTSSQKKCNISVSVVEWNPDISSSFTNSLLSVGKVCKVSFKSLNHI